MANGVIAIDREGTIFGLNHAAERLLGMEKGKAGGILPHPTFELRVGERPAVMEAGDGTTPAGRRLEFAILANRAPMSGME